MASSAVAVATVTLLLRFMTDPLLTVAEITCPPDRGVDDAQRRRGPPEFMIDFSGRVPGHRKVVRDAAGTWAARRTYGASPAPASTRQAAPAGSGSSSRVAEAPP